MITPLIPANDPLRTELAPDERLLWSGAPPTGLRLGPADVVLVPFSLMWGGGALFWEAQVLRSNAPLFFALWGLPFVAVGVFLIAGRFFVDAWIRARTTYAVTSQRVLIVQSGQSGQRISARTVKSIPLASLTAIAASTRRDGTGRVVLGGAALPYGLTSGSRGRRAAGVPTLEGVDNPEAVAELIRRAQREAR